MLLLSAAPIPFILFADDVILLASSGSDFQLALGFMVKLTDGLVRCQKPVPLW